MDIGRPKRVYRVEPVKEPVPAKRSLPREPSKPARKESTPAPAR
jgi:hypothetical protein